METSELMTVEQVAEVAGLSIHAVYKEIREGRLPTVDLGFQHQMLVTPRAVAAWRAGRFASGLSVEDVMQILGASRSSVSAWAQQELLRGSKVRGRWVFEPADVVAFAKSKGLPLDEAELEARAA